MQIYHYDPATGEYIGATEARLSPLDKPEDEVYLVPAHATMNVPPVTGKWQAAVFANSEWSIKPDWRKAELYSTVTGTPVSIKEIGETPADIPATEQAPLSDTQEWDGEKWVESDAKAAALLASASKAALNEIFAHLDQIAVKSGAFSYPYAESNSWPTQLAEAKLVADGQAIPSPLLNEMVKAQADPTVTVQTLATSIIKKAAAANTLSAQIRAMRIKAQTEIGALKVRGAIPPVVAALKAEADKIQS
jgi:hypothetical protein